MSWSLRISVFLIFLYLYLCFSLVSLGLCLSPLSGSLCVLSLWVSSVSLPLSPLCLCPWDSLGLPFGYLSFPVSLNYCKSLSQGLWRTEPLPSHISESLSDIHPRLSLPLSWWFPHPGDAPAALNPERVPPTWGALARVAPTPTPRVSTWILCQTFLDPARPELQP